MLAKKTYKNQITIPKAVIDAFMGVEYFDVQKRENEIVLKPVKVQSDDQGLNLIRQKMAKLGITVKDIEASITQARKAV